MHFFHNPGCAPTFDELLTRMPKRAAGRLILEPTKSTEIGWGVHFIEEPDWVKICLLAFFVLFLSLFFAILWTLRMGDIQGGFGVAGFVAAAAVLVGCLQVATY